jgi:hypothetical protein
MLQPLFADLGKTPESVTPAGVLAWVDGSRRSGRVPSSTTVGAPIVCLSSFYRFLARMSLVVSNPCDAVEHSRGPAQSGREQEQPTPTVGVGGGSIASRGPPWPARPRAARLWAPAPQPASRAGCSQFRCQRPRDTISSSAMARRGVASMRIKNRSVDAIRLRAY